MTALPNWAKGVITLAVCWLAFKLADTFLKMGDGSEW